MARAMHDKDLAKRKALEAKEVAKVKLANLDYSGIGLTHHSGKYAVRVNLADAKDPDKRYPKTIRGVPIVYKVTGRIRKQPAQKTTINSKSGNRLVMRSTLARTD